MVPEAVPGAPPLPPLPVLVTPLLLLAPPPAPLPPCDEDETPLLLDDPPPAPLVAEDVLVPPPEQAAAATAQVKSATRRGPVKAWRSIDPQSTTSRAASARIVVGSRGLVLQTPGNAPPDLARRHGPHVSARALICR